MRLPDTVFTEDYYGIDIDYKTASQYNVFMLEQKNSIIQKYQVTTRTEIRKHTSILWA